MNTTTAIVWQAFLQSTPSDRHNQLLACMTPLLSQEFEALPFSCCDISQGIETEEEELKKIHFSWLAPLLRSLSENDVKLFISCLTPQQIAGLKQSLLLTNSLPTLSTLGTTFISKTLFNMIADENLLPPSCLPAHPLNQLLDLSSAELTSLIELLSMHDLSIEIRHVIETSKLKEIYAILTKAQTTFLKTLVHKKEPVSFKKIGLVNWKGDREGLRSILIQRGINRIAKSLYGHHPSLLWHAAHRFDSEKGSMLLKLCTALDHPRAATLLSDQVVELVNLIKNTNPAANA